MTEVCENCFEKNTYHSSNIDSFTGHKFDILFCNNCKIGKTKISKDFDFSTYYPKNYYGKDGKKFNFFLDFSTLPLNFM